MVKVMLSTSVFCLNLFLTGYTDVMKLILPPQRKMKGPVTGL